jgi:ABC-type phosphate transport system substrate-binding protein
LFASLSLLSALFLSGCGSSGKAGSGDTVALSDNAVINGIQAAYSTTSGQTTIEYQREAKEGSGTYTIILEGKPRSTTYPFQIAPPQGSGAATGLANLSNGQFTFASGSLQLKRRGQQLSGTLSGKMVSRGLSDTLDVAKVSFSNLPYVKADY